MCREYGLTQNQVEKLIKHPSFPDGLLTPLVSGLTLWDNREVSKWIRDNMEPVTVYRIKD